MVQGATEKSSVVVIDDHPLFRKGLIELIAMAPELEVVGEASSGEEGLALVDRARPDLVLLDLNMKPMGGIETLRRIKAGEHDCRVVMVTVSDADEDVVAALRNGADGYLLKDMEPEQTLEEVRAAAHGKLVISDSLTALLARALRQEASQPVELTRAGLTPREEEIIALVAQGFSNKLIGRKLEISEGTVKVHIKHILKKLNLRTRVEVAVWYTTQHG